MGASTAPAPAVEPQVAPLEGATEPTTEAAALAMEVDALPTTTAAAAAAAAPSSLGSLNPNPAPSSTPQPETTHTPRLDASAVDARTADGSADSAVAPSQLTAELLAEVHIKLLMGLLELRRACRAEAAEHAADPKGGQNGGGQNAQAAPGVSDGGGASGGWEGMEGAGGGGGGGRVARVASGSRVTATGRQHSSSPSKLGSGPKGTRGSCVRSRSPRVAV